MTETPHALPGPPDDDQWLDRQLAALGHFAPSPGFEDRVMARLQLARPRVSRVSARPLRWVVRRGWPVGASLAGTAAATSTALTTWLALHAGAVLSWAAARAGAAALAAWQASLGWVVGATLTAGSWVLSVVLSGGLSQLLWGLAIVTLAVPVSLVGLYAAARPPARMPSYVAR